MAQSSRTLVVRALDYIDLYATKGSIEDDLEFMQIAEILVKRVTSLDHDDPDYEEAARASDVVTALRDTILAKLQYGSDKGA